MCVRESACVCLTESMLGESTRGEEGAKVADETKEFGDKTWAVREYVIRCRFYCAKRL